MNATTLDQVLAASMRLASTGVLVMAREQIHYQKGCGRGRPTFQHHVMLRHRKDTANEGAWMLPTNDVAANIALEPCGDFLLAQVDSEFEPAIGSDKFEYQWHHEAIANDHPWTHPTAAKAINQFIKTFHDSLPRIGDQHMTESRSEFVAAQAKANRVAQLFGDEAPPFLNGETLLAYRQRLARPFQVHSKAFKEVDLSKCGCPNALTVFENQIYLDASTAVLSGATAGPGQLVPIVTMDASNRPITRYVSSDDGACWDRHNPPPRIVKGGIGALMAVAKGHMQ